MLKNVFRLITILFTFFSNSAEAQQPSVKDFTPDPAKVQMYLPYLAARHGGPDSLEVWKQNNLIRYYEELWYYTESFSFIKDHLSEGVSLNQRAIDISRFEHQRLADQQLIVVIPGYRDALVLRPRNTLLHKPEYVK